MNNRRNNQSQNSPQSRQDARAPYNFVPLPERAVDVREQWGEKSTWTDETLHLALPAHNVYCSDRRHGYFDITLTTESPLYIRGMLSHTEAENKEAHRNKPDFFHTGNPNIPIIPGSSLRGMIRALVEIVTWSKLTRVSESPKIFYRAVAAKNDDPLGSNYKAIIGTVNNLKVRAGYLERDGDNWFIRPAQEHQGTPYLKVKCLDKTGKRHSDVAGVRGLIHLDDANYSVQYHDVTINLQTVRKLPSGYYAPAQSPTTGSTGNAVLVCTGNMAESSSAKNGRVSTNRRNFVAVLRPASNTQRIQIDPQAITDYRDGLTPFQKEPPFDEKYGCLVEGRPIFYVPPTQGRMVQYFGHAPFSRIQASITEGGKTRAVTPSDLVPKSLHEQADHFDFAEALFGYVRGAETTKTLDSQQIKQGDPRRAYASRISVSDAKMVTQTDDPYDIDAGGITPPILGSPKPTTFQHYLEQPHGKSTPKQDLHHYGTNSARIRGHKLYWRQRIQAVPTDPDASPESKQHTRIRPLKKGIRFKFRVDFENLTDIELGALAWVLALGSNNHYPNARHMLGMGKPFGMGVIKLDTALVLRDRQQRYTSLFSNMGWSNGDAVANIDEIIPQFIEFISTAVGESYSSRMQELLTILEGCEPNPRFTYMQLEPTNEYKDRPVLPYPTEVIPSPEMLAQQEQERQRQKDERRQAEEQRRQQQEAAQRKADKVTRRDMIGDEIRGQVFEVTSKGEIWFTFTWLDGKEYEGVIPQDRVLKKRSDGDTINARVLEQRERNGRIEVTCEQIIKDKKK
jgi:CRISPR-associated protein (TIGR03986 family)